MKIILLVFALWIGTATAFGQLNYPLGNIINTAGTYTDLGVSGSVIATANFDDANSAPTEIGFPFTYNGTTFTQFILNTNGFIKLGNAPPSGVALFGTNINGAPGNVLINGNAADVNLLAAFNFDLKAGTNTPEYRVVTSGLFGTRVCTIQFKNLRDKKTPETFGNIEFQIKLYEGTNAIEFVYGSWAIVNSTGFGVCSVTGLKGSNNTSAQIISGSKNPNTEWSEVSFINSNTAYFWLFGNGVLAPDMGRTFRFQPGTVSATGDAAVQAVYTLGKLPKDNGAPHGIKALVQNTGSSPITNLPVTLTVSGANSFSNTQTVASLPVGFSQVVSFAGFSPSALGTNAVTVTVPSDANGMNNAASYTQIVTSDAYGYADESSVNGTPVGYGTAAGLLLVKYTMNGTNAVRGVRVFLANNPATAGKPLYAVVMDASGAIVATSPTYTPQPADLNQYQTINFTAPVNLTNTDFYVGLAQPASAVAYFPLGAQIETPTRSGAYYSAALTGGAVSEVTTLGRFAIEATLGLIVPVELAAFSGTVKDGVVRLEWRTATERNNAGFEVERLAVSREPIAGNRNWEKIGFVRGAGTTTEERRYSFADEASRAGEAYRYRLRQIDFDGQMEVLPEIEVRVGKSESFRLGQNYPNPFNPETAISYQLGAVSEVSLKVFDVLGREVSTLVNERKSAGNYSVRFSAAGLASGVYFYRLQAASFVETRKMVLVK